jgi:hypothetical protein
VNPKIEQIEAAEAAIVTFTAEEERIRSRALQDGIIDAQEQADLDRVAAKIGQLRNVVRTLRATVEENRRIWDAQQPSRAEWTEQLITLHSAAKPDLAAFDTAETEMTTAVADQRWADATQVLNTTLAAMAPVYAAYLAEVAALVAVGGAPGSSPPAPSVNADQDQWTSVQASYTRAMTALERHVQAGHAVIAAEIATTKASAAAAVALANGGDFAAAVTAMTPLIAACAATEDRAHDVAHYSAVRLHRVGLVATYRGSLTGDAAIDSLQTEIETLLADAQTDAAAGKFDDAIAKLDRIPPIFDRSRGLDDMRVQYGTLNPVITADIATIDATAAADRALLQAQIDRFKAEFAAAQIAQTNDYSVSVPRLTILNAEVDGILTMIGDSAAYTAALTAFQAGLAKIEPHAGRIAVEEFYQAKLIDRDQAATDAASARFPAANVILGRTTLPKWDAQKAIADAYVTYQANRLAAQAIIETVRALPNTADLIAQADTLMVTATNQAVAKDIAAAEISVADAQGRARDAQTASEAQSALTALRDDAALDGVAADFPAALAVFTNMRAYVVGQDSSGTFTAAIAEADIPVNAARAEIGGGTPDIAVVRANLDAGIAVLEAVLPQIIAYGLFQTHLAAATTLSAALLPLSVSNDECIKPAIDACNALIAEAVAFAQAPGHDFVSAERKLAEAMERGRMAQANVTLYSSNISPNKAAMTTAIATINGAGANIAARMVATISRLNDLLSDITVAIAAEDFTLAAAKGVEGASVAGAVVQDVAICQTIDADYATFVTNQIGRIQGGQPEVAAALVLANTNIVAFNASMAAGSYRSATQSINEISWAIGDGDMALAGAALYNPAQATARAKLDGVAALRNPSIDARLTALEDRYTTAVALGAEPQYTTATARMGEIATDADTLLPIAQAFASYDEARIAAEAKLLEAEAHAQLDAIQTMVTLLRAKYASAEQLASQGDPARAQTMMEEVKTGAENAIADADSSAIFAGIAEAIGDSSSDTGGPTFLHIAAARKAYDWQASKPNAAVASAELAEANTKLALAENAATPPADQTIALQSAMDLVTQAGQIISQHVLLVEALAAARAQVAALRAHPQSAYLDTQLSAMEIAITDVETSATDLAALPGCSTDLQAIIADVLNLRTKLDAQAEYLTLRASPDVEPRLATLEAHAHSYAIQPDIAAIRSKLAEAARLSESFDPVPAVALLNEVKTIGLGAFVLAQMRDNTPPTAAEIQAIISSPGGDAQLDTMLDALEPDAQRAVLEIAFEARFGCNLQQFGANNPGLQQPGPNIRRFYEIMSDLPPTDTLDNDSLRTFTDRPNARGASDYTGGNVKEVVMREGDAVLSNSYTFGAEYQVGDVEEDCEPTNDDPVNFFSWNTLHEVGHAVDDQHSFMNGRQSGPDFGGWTVYGGNTAPIATVLAAHFNYDKTYIEQSMGERLAIPGAGGNPADIAATTPEPQGCSAEEWEGRRVTFGAWLGRVREPRQPWASQSTAQQIAINGVVFQECYTGSWVSYQLAARSRGMTAYQFRSPAEWFSELYAAYHSGKIKDTHPSAEWLSKLAGPDA